MDLATVSLLSPERLSAQEAGLIHVSDQKPGIVREKYKQGFRYRGKDGVLIVDENILNRLRKLAIPPAYQQVWICPHPNGHIQATGRDARGRKQYRYHVRWRAVRDSSKYDRMQAFGSRLPAIRRRVEQDLRLAGLPRDKVLAVIVRLLETTLIRVGNDEYARDNGSFGLTTLRNRHVGIAGSRLSFSFVGKSGVRHEAGVEDARLARIIKRCRELPGQELFQYLDEAGERRTLGSADVNDYLRNAAGAEFTAKDYRTWAGSVMAYRALRKPLGKSADEVPTVRRVVEVIKDIAAGLGNTPAVCRKCYVHPAVLDAYLEGRLGSAIPTKPKRGLKVDEAAFLQFINALSSRRAARKPARK
ncbi:DNA topoisomerase IB [uncultured Nevskia sp.]|uniref:DNA topoisomerase IB n=1 Tax=uncultured Nevskia sp. TaxID=228950 RepID=UPI0025EA55F3|nr:DNA topoisomerase IB [uncultured Nevskia sp.]